MYEKFYGLREKPFRIVPNPHYLFFTDKHQNALTYLEYGVRENVGFILLTGEIGTGKTTLIRHLLNQIEAAVDVAVIFHTNVTADQLLNLVLREYDLAPAPEKGEALERLHHFLIDRYAAGQQVLLIIDEAQNLSDEALEEVRMLSNLQSDDELLLKIMLVGQPELKRKLQQPSLAQLGQRIAVNYHLTGLSREETGGYVDARLVKAGGKQGLFTPEALDVLHHASGGIPRMINILCDTALVYGFADGLPVIEPAVIRQVLEDKGAAGSAASATGPEGPEAPGLLSGPEQAEWPPDFLARISGLEENVKNLQVQVAWQVEELERRADRSQHDLVKHLRELREQERRQFDLLLENHGRLREQYEKLLAEREGQAASQEEPTEGGAGGSLLGRIRKRLNS